MIEKINVDPASLEHFVGNTRRSLTEIENIMRSLRTYGEKLSQDWKDHEYDAFVQDYRKTLKVLEVFVRDMTNHQNFVSKKAARAREYQKVGGNR